MVKRPVRGRMLAVFTKRREYMEYPSSSAGPYDMYIYTIPF